MLEQHQCEDCFMSFDNPQALNSHKEKFCIHSKYADLDSLTKEYDQIKGNKSIQKSYFRPPSEHPSLKSSQYSYTLNGSNEKEYRELLRVIGDREDLRKKLEREKLSAQQELDVLQKKEKDLFLNARKRELEDVVKNRQKILIQEEQLQKEIKQFEKERKEESRARHMQADDDFAFREGREAGKLAMQRRLLEEKKRQIQTNIKLKKREEEKVNLELQKINDEPIFVPEYRKKESTVKRPNYEIRQQTLPNDFPSPKPLQKPETPVPKQPQRKPYAESIIKPVSLQASSKKSMASEVNDDYLKAALFSGKERTLFESLNPKGKSDEDIFIESLVAQEYDALNILARLPKDSELYAVKMKQFQEMSRIRQELKDKIQKVRFDKVRRQFEMEKNMTQTEKANVEWLDKNRKHMLNREVDILHNQSRRNQLENSNPQYGDPNLPLDAPQMRRQQTTQGLGPTRQQTRPPEFPSIDSISQPRLPTQQGSRGYKITVKSLRGYNNRSAMCVKIVVLEEDSNNGQWTFATKYHDQAAPKDDRNPYNPTVKNRLDQSGAIVFNESFEIREDLQSRYNNNQNEIYLWVMVMEKDDLKMTNEPELYLWYCFKLTHFGHIREGAFNLALYYDDLTFPTPTDMNRMKGKASEEILIELSECQLTQERKPPEIDIPRNRTTRTTKPTGTQNPLGSGTNVPPNGTGTNRTGRRLMQPRPSDPKINSIKNINQQFFIENQKPSQFQEVKAGQKRSFNFAICGLRTLPSYLGPLKLQVRFIDNQNDDILPPDDCMADFGNDMYNPKVTFSKEVTNQDIPSSTVIVIRLIAISTLSYQPGLVGSCFFHIGYNDSGEGLQTDQQSFYLINGLYQLPIYWGNIEDYLNTPQLLDNFPPIPCSSILVSIKEGNQKPASFPTYSQGLFNTIFFTVDETQYRLFREQVKRQRQKTLDYVEGYYKFKGVSIKDYSQNDLKKLLAQTLAFNNENTSNIFMLEAMAEYNSAFGVRVHIDSMKIPPGQTNYYYFTTSCLFPPAKYYSQDKCDLDFLYRIELGSSFTQSLALNHDPLFYYPPYDPNTCLIIEVNRIQLSPTGSPESGVQTCAFTVLPLFDLEVSVPCANIGFKEMFLKEGQFDKRELQSLQANSVRYIQLMQGQKKSDFGLLMRVQNGYFPKQLMGVRGGGQGKPLRSIFQNSKGFRSAIEGAKKIIEDTYGISLS